MPTTSRLYIKASIVYLGLGALLGVLLLIQRWIPLGSAISYLRPVHIEFLIVGWVTQLILGVAWWFFPPLAIGQRDRDQWRGQVQRGRERLFWVTFALLNAGVLFYALGEPLYTWTGSGLFSGLVALSGLCLLGAAVTFVINMWGRVREITQQ
jgi:hypothetical protein